MPKKSARVTARVEPEVKRRAEAILEEIGVPVSVLIDTLYRQIILTGGVSVSTAVRSYVLFDNAPLNRYNRRRIPGEGAALRTA